MDRDPREEEVESHAKARSSAAGEGCVHEQLMSELLHDLRSPLAAVGMLAEMVLASSQTDTTVDVRKLELMQEAVIKAQRIVDDAAEIRNIHRGLTPLDLLSVDLGYLVQSCAEKARHASWSKNMTLEVVDPQPMLVLADLEKAESVVLKVLEEAALRMPQAGVVQVVQSFEGQFGVLQIQVRLPDGPGAIVRRGAFNGTRGRLGSRRLGESRYSLVVCSRVMELMQGELKVLKYPPGVSTQLRFRLPD